MSEPQPFDKISLLRLAFPRLHDDELQEIADLTELRTYPPGYILCQEGAYEDLFYIIADGDIVITQMISEDEGERVLRVGGKGDLVGEMALIQNKPRSATVWATSDCTVLEMEKEDFETILSRSPRMAMDIIGITLDRMRANDRMSIEDLQKTNQILRQLDRNKLEFIQVAAHELRTPLTVLKGYIDVLHSFPEIKANAVFQEVYEGIIKGANRMHEVVNLMLDITRIDSQTALAKAVPVLLKPMINEIVRDFRRAAQQRKIKIAVHHAKDLPNIYADPSMIQKALYHLLVNAIKYTPDGGRVELRTGLAQMDGGAAGVEVAVEDTGIGLDLEHSELVFEKFYQVGSVSLHSSGETEFKSGGPGLGLAIVRGVAESHGGKVWVESPGHDEVNYPGSTFYLQLPINLPDA
jgi:signal transduction histidine kinase